jgi:hypothetical protein
MVKKVSEGSKRITKAVKKDKGLKIEKVKPPSRVSNVIEIGAGRRPKLEFKKIDKDAYLKFPIDNETIKIWLESQVYHSPRLHE